jgi:hypothetical protein
MKVSMASRYARSYLATGRRGPYPSDYVPYRFQPHHDNTEHRLTHADTLPTLAAHYFVPLPRACGLWWVIADYQPSPIINPLEALYTSRRMVVVPSLRVVTDIILRGEQP